MTVLSLDHSWMSQANCCMCFGTLAALANPTGKGLVSSSQASLLFLVLSANQHPRTDGKMARKSRHSVVNIADISWNLPGSQLHWSERPFSARKQFFHNFYTLQIFRKLFFLSKMLVEIFIFSAVTLFFRFKCRLFIPRKTAAILNGRCLLSLRSVFCRRSTQIRSRFSAVQNGTFLDWKCSS